MNEGKRTGGQTLDKGEEKVLIKNLAERFKTSDRRIRNYSDELEKQGYTFSKTTVGYRLYSPTDVEIIGKVLQSKEDFNLTVETAVSMVLNNGRETDATSPSDLKPIINTRELLEDVQTTVKTLTEHLPSRNQIEHLLELVEGIVQQDQQKDEIIKIQDEMVEQLRIEREKDKEIFLKSQKQHMEMMSVYQKSLDDNKRFKEIIEETRQHFNELDKTPIGEKKGFFSKLFGTK